MRIKILWILVAIFAILIGLYPNIYLLTDRKFGLLGSKPDELLTNVLWNLGFYTHIFLGGLALLVGWPQFSSKWREKHLKWHRKLGKIYVFSVLISAVTGFFIAIFATGGLIPAIGFMSLAIIWFYTTYKAYIYIRRKQIEAHQKMMIYSYAACFAAVTLRIWLPLLIMHFNDFIVAYKIVAWLCWVPNLIIAYLIVMQTQKKVALKQINN